MNFFFFIYFILLYTTTNVRENCRIYSYVAKCVLIFSGLLGVLFYVHFIMGLLYTYVLASFTDNLKVINILCLIWPVIHVIGVFFIPESPYVHLKNNKTEEATASITKLRDDNTVTQELSVIQVHS